LANLEVWIAKTSETKPYSFLTTYRGTSSLVLSNHATGSQPDIFAAHQKVPLELKTGVKTTIFGGNHLTDWPKKDGIGRMVNRVDNRQRL
jgi:hypothetical protein